MRGNGTLPAMMADGNLLRGPAGRGRAAQEEGNRPPKGDGRRTPGPVLALTYAVHRLPVRSGAPEGGNACRTGKFPPNGDARRTRGGPGGARRGPVRAAARFAGPRSGARGDAGAAGRRRRAPARAGRGAGGRAGSGSRGGGAPPPAG